MKKIKKISMAGLLILSLTSSVCFGANSIFIDTEEIKNDIPPYFENTVLMVPLRHICEGIGYNVNWYDDIRLAEVTMQGYPEKVISAKIGSNEGYFYGSYDKMGNIIENKTIMESSAVIVKDRTFVPLSFIQETLNYTTEYDKNENNVFLYSQEYAKDVIEKKLNKNIPLNKDEKEELVSCKTENWISLKYNEKVHILSLLCTYLKDEKDREITDYNELYIITDRQMEQYHRNKVNWGIIETVCDIFGIN